MAQEFYIDQPEEIEVLSPVHYKHYMNGKEMVKRFIEGHKKIQLKNRQPFNLKDAESKAKSLFKEGQMYFLKEGKIFNIIRE